MDGIYLVHIDWFGPSATNSDTNERQGSEPRKAFRMLIIDYGDLIQWLNKTHEFDWRREAAAILVMPTGSKAIPSTAQSHEGGKVLQEAGGNTDAQGSLQRAADTAQDTAVEPARKRYLNGVAAMRQTPTRGHSGVQ